MSQPAASPEQRLGEILRARGWNIAVAETTTGGLISARIVAVPGSSTYFERGIIAYSKASKTLVGVDEALIASHGAVSPEMASAMAEGVREVSGVDVGIAETGIAGPIQGRSPKPLGSAFIAVSLPDGTTCEHHVFNGDRTEIREQIARRAILMALEGLDSEG